MAVIHITEAEAARDLHELIEKVAAGDTVHIDSARRTFAIVPVVQPRTWTVDEALNRSAASGVHAYLDDDFADDMEEIMRLNRLPREGQSWESS